MGEGMRILKDACVLGAITLAPGLLLGAVYVVTKDPIAQQEQAKKMDAYGNVFSAAEGFQPSEKTETVQGEAADILLQAGGDEYESVTINEILEAVDADGSILGYVVSVTSGSGYGGDISLTVGVDLDGSITGVEITESSETVGLGANASEESFRSQYVGKQVDHFVVTKNGSQNDNEIDAISGATITSNAVTDAVNAVLCCTETFSLEGGGA